MQKKHLLLLASGIFFALPILFFAMYRVTVYAQKSKASTQETQAPNITAQEPVLTSLLSKESGMVEYKLPNDTEFQILEVTQNIPTNTQVRTLDDGLAHVIFPDNSMMSLSKNTQVTVTFEESSINIFQSLGNTWHRVEKVLGGHSYSVETSSSLATVRGTEFNVGVISEVASEVYVIDSIVDVSKIKNLENQKIIEDTKQLTKDKHVVVQATAPTEIVVKPMPESKKKSEWFERNKQITKKIEKVKEEKKQEQPKNERNTDDTVLDTPTLLNQVLGISDESTTSSQTQFEQNRNERLRRTTITPESIQELISPTSTPNTTPQQIRVEPTATIEPTPTTGAETQTSTQGQQPRQESTSSPSPTQEQENSGLSEFDQVQIEQF